MIPTGFYEIKNFEQRKGNSKLLRIEPILGFQIHFRVGFFLSSKNYVDDHERNESGSGEEEEGEEKGQMDGKLWDAVWLQTDRVTYKHDGGILF
ncbi:hypothetical protein RRG08_058260 [Elysia crispata]|uniref:Uncharacterized protein n=1 Tax=Elysia crispata TaxID=231223 RepID=A0AAE0YWR1_9GAST|nr:hypothetical protein RRG08_058260 [Elysia crispata]